MKKLKSLSLKAYLHIVHPLVESWPVLLIVGLAFALAKN